MTNFKFLNLDSAASNCSYSTNQTYSTYAINSANANYPNSFNSVFTLQTPVVNAKRMWLKSIELPVGFPNIRAYNGSSTITLSTAQNGSGTNYTITLPDKIYNSTKLLLDDINAAFIAAYPSIYIAVFAFNTTTGMIQLDAEPSIALFPNGIFLQPNILVNTILGFPTSYTTNSLIRDATKMYILNADLYITLYLPGLSSDNINAASIPSSFKIPLPVPSGGILFQASNLSFDACINLTNTSIGSITCVIKDRFGYSISSRGLDWSATIAFEF